MDGERREKKGEFGEEGRKEEQRVRGLKEGKNRREDMEKEKNNEKI